MILSIAVAVILAVPALAYYFFIEEQQPVQQPMNEASMQLPPVTKALEHKHANKDKLAENNQIMENVTAANKKQNELIEIYDKDCLNPFRRFQERWSDISTIEGLSDEVLEGYYETCLQLSEGIDPQ